MSIEPGNLSLGALAGGLIGIFAGHYLTKSRNTEERGISNFNKAATEFHCAFTEVIVAISDLEAGREVNDIDQILIKSYTLHRNALLRFKTCLSESEREAIEKEWENYCYGEILPGEDRLPESFGQYNVDIGQFEETRRLALANINRLLSFAKIK